jgi:hypothetical protein
MHRVSHAVQLFVTKALFTLTESFGMQAGAAGMFMARAPLPILSDNRSRYRNFLMACAALMDQSFQPLYFPLLDAPIGPGVRNLQTWIETAWKAGNYSFQQNEV